MTVDESSTQVCTKCGIEKPLTDYPIRTNGRPYRQCNACAVERMRQWRLANPARYREAQTKLRTGNRERYRKYALDWYYAHPEQAKAASRKWKQSPEGGRSNRRTARRAFDRKREWLDQFKVGKKCVDCKRKFLPFVLDFDHVRGVKKFTLGDWMNGKVQATEQEVRDEIAKCELRCANCHRIRHYTRLPGV